MIPLPNIVFLLADDLGWGDPGCNNPGSKVPTPNIDRLAREGMRFTNAYCPDSICTPSRYSLMTGRYSFRTTQTAAVQFNWEPPLIEAGRLTLPEVLRLAGYATGGFGKWHLGADFPTVDGQPPIGQYTQRHAQDGANVDLAAPLRGGPLDRGFEEWYGFICVSESLVYDGRYPVDTVDVYPHPKARGTEGLRHLVLQDYLPEVTRRAAGFLDRRAAEAKQGKPFFLYYAPYVPHVPLAVPEAFKGRTKGGPYGDYVAALDHHIGILLERLDRMGGDTLVVFASDNGSSFSDTGEGHHPNGPLRGKKGTIFEGGVRTPLLVRWPGTVSPGSVSDRLVALTDWTATAAELTGMHLPEQAAEDSFSLLPLLTGEPPRRPVREEVVLKSGWAHIAMRSGGWKYIPESGFELAGPPGPASSAQLYHLEEDPCETVNRIDDEPARAQAMRQRLQAIARASRHAPWEGCS